LRRAHAVEFSFLLSIPIILGTSLYEMKHVHPHDPLMAVYAAGVLSAFVFGLLSLRFLIRYLTNHSLDLFSYYRLGLAVLIFFLSA
jgi:undecaprenyl-diphosphatase